MKNTFRIFILCFFSIYTHAQNNIDLGSLPNVSDIIEVRSNPSADTVVIALHGGPTESLFPGHFNFIEGISTFSTVEMKQYQHTKDVLGNTNLTLEEAIIMNDTTVAMLHKVINHFNSDNKTVVIIGHSFGAFLVNEYIDDYDLNNVHRAISLSGRINMNKEIVDALAEGFYGAFESDGVTTFIKTTLSVPEALAGMKLQAGIGYNLWIDSLSNDDLTKFMVVYGENDDAVGRLLPNEIAMLKEGNANVLGIVGGGHNAPFDTTNMNQVVEFIRNDGIVSTINSLATLKVKIYPTIVEDYLTVVTEKKGRLEIFNSNGQILFTENCVLGTTKISAQNIPSGFYVTRFKASNRKIAVNRIIKN